MSLTIVVGNEDDVSVEKVQLEAAKKILSAIKANDPVLLAEELMTFVEACKEEE
jgi:hypothetical protein